MRKAFFLIVAVAIAAGAGWLLRDRTARDPHAPAGDVQSKAASSVIRSSADNTNPVPITTRRAQVAATLRSSRSTTESSAPARNPGPVPAFRAPSAGASPTATPAKSADAKPVAAPEELVAKFTEDDPTQVFPAQSVQIHAAVQAEPSDPDWGPLVAKAIHDFIAAALGDRAALINVDCRTDLCEVQIVARIGGDVNADMQKFQEIMGLLHKDPLWDEYGLDQTTSIVAVGADQRAIEILYISRK